MSKLKKIKIPGYLNEDAANTYGGGAYPVDNGDGSYTVDAQFVVELMDNYNCVVKTLDKVIKMLNKVGAQIGELDGGGE